MMKPLFSTFVVGLLGSATFLSAQGSSSSSQGAAVEPLKIVRMFGDESGETHLQTIELKLGPGRGRSEVLNGPGTAQFAWFSADMNADWHTTNRRKYLVTLSGAGYELEVTDGTRTAFPPGSILLADDMGSKGHQTRALGGESLVMYVDTDDIPVP